MCQTTYVISSHPSELQLCFLLFYLLGHMFHFDFDVDDPVDNVILTDLSPPADHFSYHPRQSFFEIKLESLASAATSLHHVSSLFLDQV